ncbi:MAG TPA: negative transcriptional regulator [Rhodobacteraceae bacterium]|nr:negative transcriptional regulator [Paracoccaceae bacterium]
MHPSPAFRTAPPDQNIAFARARGFGQLSINGGFGPLAAHVPFMLDDTGETAFLHLVRSNPILDALDQPLPALLAVSGPDGYMSPDWYGVPDQVPTWNYVAVHLRGSLERLPDTRLGEVLDLLSDTFERRLAPKPPWRAEKMDPQARARMMRAIVPLRMTVEEVRGTWKLSQNKPDDVRLAAADAAPGGVGQELDALAELMREYARDPQEGVDS